MEIVISGYYGFDNAGDEAILLSMIQTLKNDFPAISITILSNQPKKTKELYGVNAVNRWSFKEILKAIKKSDGVISGGGTLLQDKTGPTSISYYCCIMWIAHLNGKPFFVYAQGIGPIKSKFNNKIVSLTLKKASLITVRDALSKLYIENMGMKKQILVVPDPVLGMHIEKNFHSNWLNSELQKQTFIVVSVRHWRKGINHIERIASGLNPLAEKGRNIVFVPMHGIDDYQCSLDVRNKMTKKAQNNTFIAPHDLSIQEKVTIIGESQLVIGMRLHSLIFAANKSIPFLSISYDPKIDVFTEVCGQKLIGDVETLSWDANTLTNEAEYCISSTTLLKENILKYTSEASKKAELTATKIFKKLLIKKVYLNLSKY